MILLFVIAGAVVYFMVTALVVAIIWMFTTVFGLALLVLFVLGVVGNLLAPTDEEKDEEIDMDDRDL